MVFFLLLLLLLPVDSILLRFHSDSFVLLRHICLSLDSFREIFFFCSGAYLAGSIITTITTTIITALSTSFSLSFLAAIVVLTQSRHYSSFP